MSKKSKTILLALFLGGFGIQKFYLDRVGQGLLCVFFFWTFIPTIVAIIDIIRFAIMSEEEFAKRYP